MNIVPSNSVRSHPTGVTEHQKLQFEFWTEFRAYAEKFGIPVQKPCYQNWLPTPIGRSDFHLDSIINSTGREVRVELLMKSTKAKQRFDALAARKQQLEGQIDTPLVWHCRGKTYKIYARRNGDFQDRSQWPELFAWLLRYLAMFRAVFGPAVKAL